MTEKIKCKNKNCSSMILPRTSEETGGLCMPCAGKRVTAKTIKEYMDQSFAYEHFCEEDQLHIVCVHCRGPVVLFENLNQEIKRKIAQYRFDGETMKAMRLLRQTSGCDLGQAKWNLYHLRTNDGLCHNCFMELRKGSLICPRCMAVNLCW